MKTLNSYITEKLKLSNIDRDNLDGRWISANHIKFNDLVVGDVLETKNKIRYVIAPAEFVKEIMAVFDIEGYQGKLLIRKGENLTMGKYGYVHLQSYKISFPAIVSGIKDLTINRVYKNKKVFKNKEDLDKYLDFIDSLD